MEADDTDYKDQARYLLADLNQRYIMLQRPTWFTMPILLPLILIICALTAILANCYIEPSTIVSGVLEQTETIEGLKFRFEMFELYATGVVSVLLVYAQYSASDNSVYCALPWIIWTLFGMLFKEIPGLYYTSVKIVKLSLLHGLVLSTASAILLYLQFCLVRIVWKKNKWELGNAILGNVMFFDNYLSHPEEFE